MRALLAALGSGILLYLSQGLADAWSLAWLARRWYASDRAATSSNMECRKLPQSSSITIASCMAA